ncbi:MAG: NYN domain-containing protein [Planctomycetota bacterium]
MPEYIIIDGYNLLHTLGTRRSLGGPGNLQRAREELAGRIAARLDPEQRARTTIVFDANSETRDLPAVIDVQGIRVEFAHGIVDADSKIELMLKQHSTPRSVVVVSNDRRVRQAAERRRARAVDCESWFDSLGLDRSEQDRGPVLSEAGEEVKDNPEMSAAEREVWMQLFQGAAKDASRKEARGKDARGRDARGRDARGRDARGKENRRQSE